MRFTLALLATSAVAVNAGERLPDTTNLCTTDSRWSFKCGTIVYTCNMGDSPKRADLCASQPGSTIQAILDKDMCNKMISAVILDPWGSIEIKCPRSSISDYVCYSDPIKVNTGTGKEAYSEDNCNVTPDAPPVLVIDLEPTLLQVGEETPQTPETPAPAAVEEPVVEVLPVAPEDPSTPDEPPAPEEPATPEEPVDEEPATPEEVAEEPADEEPVAPEEPVTEPTSDSSCSCGPGSTVGSWKCGTTVYYCPHVTTICSNQLQARGAAVKLTEAECATYQSLNLEDKCPVAEKDVEIRPKSLSNMVCYDMNADGSFGSAVKVDSSSCDVCTVADAVTPAPPAVEEPVVKVLPVAPEDPATPEEPTDEDPATPEEPADEEPATPEEPIVPVEPVVEEDCPMEYLALNNGLTLCPSGQSIVMLTGTAGYDGATDANGVGVIYGIELDPTGSTITFKVDNPFADSADIYVKHEIAGNADGFLEPICEEEVAQPACLEADSIVDNTFTVACRSHGYARVYVYFATSDASVLGFTGADAEIDHCCYPPEYDLSTTGIVELVYNIQCACPPTSQERHLLRGSNNKTL
jgi:hypothetical protein